ncbi:peptidylprolyl isomerase [Paramaledivibacter caminithermalis]|uniref:peptidylprolyl isomerase n=1 Tax=Paramaledivibacter caminithermalis TaxID=191027 RepID=UPI0009338AF5|nr:peptidylprolyl isomerase [Paramaledivibacter caminithermalis]
MIQINKKMISVTLILILLIGALAGCSNAGGAAKVDENVVAKVNGKEIDYDSFKKNFSIIEKRYNEWYTENIWSQEINGKTVLEIVKGQVLDKLVTEELINQEAQKKGISVEDAKIEEAYNGFKERLEQDEELKKFYEENNLDESFVKDQIKMGLLVQEYEKALFDEHGLNDKEKLDELTKDYVVQVSAKHILVKDEELAKEIINKIKAGGDFTELAKENSKDPSVKDNNGDLGYFPRGAMVKQFEEAAFSMNVGEISDPVKTDYGYHIIKLEGKKTIDDLKKEVSEEELELEKQKAEAMIKQEEFIKEIEKLKSEGNIEKFEENLK